MFFKRSKKRLAADATGRPEVEEADRLAAEGRLEEAIEHLATANRSRRDPSLEVEMRALRNRAGMGLIGQKVPTEPRGYVAAAPTTGLPEIDAKSGVPEISRDDLTAPVLRGAILAHGCLLVRGLVEPDVASELAGGIELAVVTRHRLAEGDGSDPEGYYDELHPEPPREIKGRGWIAGGGGVLAADSPRLLAATLEAFKEAGLRPLIEDYLGEAPLISAEKCTLRKATPNVTGAWHQDGKFLGDVKSINIWLSLSRCGDEAPGIDVVPKRIEEYVRTGGPGAWVDNQIGLPDVEAAAGEAGIVRPVFNPGDALLFDHLCLHQTGVDESMTKPRYAIESWCFAPSAFPPDYVPMAF